MGLFSKAPRLAVNDENGKSSQMLFEKRNLSSFSSSYCSFILAP
jgi:hypothetical protein